jgi:hypothetical protein
MTEKTEAARQREPVSEPCQVGISPLVEAELGKLHPELARKIEEHVARKKG